MRYIIHRHRLADFGRARFRLYRSRFLQVHTHFAKFFTRYHRCLRVLRSELKIWRMLDYFAIFFKVSTCLQMAAPFCQNMLFSSNFFTDLCRNARRCQIVTGGHWILQKKLRNVAKSCENKLGLASPDFDSFLSLTRAEIGCDYSRNIDEAEGDRGADRRGHET